MVRSSSLSFLACLIVGRVASHPLCYVDDKPTDYDEVLTFCPTAQDGACCTDLEEAQVESAVDTASAASSTGTLSDKCRDLYTQVSLVHSPENHNNNNSSLTYYTAAADV